jgi:hypothetical protein
MVLYKIVVKTSDRNERPGSLEEADLSLQLFGSYGASDLIPLEISSTHRFPLRPGQVDLFEVQVPDVGVIESIKIDGIDPADLGSFSFADIPYIVNLLILKKKLNR